MEKMERINFIKEMGMINNVILVLEISRSKKWKDRNGKEHPVKNLVIYDTNGNRTPISVIMAEKYTGSKADYQRLRDLAINVVVD